MRTGQDCEKRTEGCKCCRWDRRRQAHRATERGVRRAADSRARLPGSGSHSRSHEEQDRGTGRHSLPGSWRAHIPWMAEMPTHSVQAKGRKEKIIKVELLLANKKSGEVWLCLVLRSVRLLLSEEQFRPFLPLSQFLSLSLLHTHGGIHTTHTYTHKMKNRIKHTFTLTTVTYILLNCGCHCLIWGLSFF